MALVASAWAWLGSDRWMLVLALVGGFLSVWTLQAVHAYRRAMEGGAAGAGASRIMVIAPIAVAAITLVFLAGGRVSTPGATFERYVHAWADGDAGTATALFAAPLSEDELLRAWSADEQRLATRLAAVAPPGAASESLPGSGLTFDSVRFEYPSVALADPSQAQVDLLIVEVVRVRSTALGIFPASTQETRVVARAGRATLRRQPIGPALPFLPAAGVWRIDRVEID